MEHVVRVVYRHTQETISEEVFENACEAYMRYHILTFANGEENAEYKITLDSRNKSLLMLDNG